MFLAIWSSAKTTHTLVSLLRLFNSLQACFAIYLRNKQSSNAAQALLCTRATVRILNWKDQISFYGTLTHEKQKLNRKAVGSLQVDS